MRENSATHQPTSTHAGLPDGVDQAYPIADSLGPQVALPPDADDTDIDEWQPDEDGKPAYRLVWSRSYNPQRFDIRVVVVQFEDGSIADGKDDPDDAPLVYIGGDEHLPADARAIAAAITRAADLADRWVGGTADAAKAVQR